MTADGIGVSAVQVPSNYGRWNVNGQRLRRNEISIDCGRIRCVRYEQVSSPAEDKSTGWFRVRSPVTLDTGVERKIRILERDGYRWVFTKVNVTE